MVGGIGRRLIPRSLRHVLDVHDWARRGYIAPSPPHIKRAVLLRLGNPNATWIETGTYIGDTAAVLSLGGGKVFTIEPDPVLYARAAQRFAGHPLVTVLNGLSEDVLPSLLPKVSGDVNFWLDGHYSGCETHRGPSDCPVKRELAAISVSIARLGNVTVLIDDLRCFDPRIAEFRDYPSRDYLVEWAHSHCLDWHVEHDIMCLKTRPGAANVA